MKKQVVTIMMLVLAMGHLNLAGENAWADDSDPKIDVTGFYVEGGGTFFVPVGNNSLEPIFGEDSDRINVSPGGGGQVALGFDTKWIGVGTKFRTEIFQAESATVDELGAFYQWDLVETKLYVADWFRDEVTPWRPYAIAGFGYNVNSVTAAGFQGNFGGGVHYHLTDSVYLGLEGTYRPMGVHALASALTIGYRF